MYRPSILWPPLKYSFIFFLNTVKAAEQVFSIILDLASALHSKCMQPFPIIDGEIIILISWAQKSS